MNINLENMLRHHGIPVEQRQALADDLFGLLENKYSDYQAQSLDGPDGDLYYFLTSYGYMRTIQEQLE